MSLYSYRKSQLIDPAFDFDTLIMGAMRKADSDNILKLQLAFPDIWAELQARYNAPGGRLKGKNCNG